MSTERNPKLPNEAPAVTTAMPIGANVFLRPLANPLSLGFLGLFFATTSLAIEEVGWISDVELHDIALGILVFTVPVQAIASLIGFLCRDMAAATGMGITAGGWATIGVNLLEVQPGSKNSALAAMLAVGAFALMMPALGAATSKLLAAAVLSMTTVRWILTAGYEATISANWHLASGASGFLLGIVSLYASLAFELEEQRRKTVLPTFRRGSGVIAMTGTVQDQVSEISHEAGVRNHL